MWRAVAEELAARGIACALAHPFCSVEAPLLARHRRRLAQLFPIWETRNGSRAPELNSPAEVCIETHGGQGLSPSAGVARCQADAAKPEDRGEQIEMPIHVQHIGAMLLGARADQQIRERHAMPATIGELALGRLGCRQYRRIDAQVPECVEVLA